MNYKPIIIAFDIKNYSIIFQKRCISIYFLISSGVLSRKVRQQKFKSVDSKLWGDSLWSTSYFAGSCRGASIEVVKQYIESQETAN